MATFSQMSNSSSNSNFLPITFERNLTLKRKRNVYSDPVRVVIAGFDDVGKTALIVRCLTKKFIGEYYPLDDKSTDFKYKYYDVLDNEDIMVEVLDTSCKGSSERFTNCENLRSADAFVLVYAINDRESFEYIEILHNRIQEARKGTQFSAILVANKSDLKHRRRISTEEGRNYAADKGWAFQETSTAEEPDKARQIFTEVNKDIWATKRKSRNFLDRVFGGIGTLKK